MTETEYIIQSDRSTNVTKDRVAAIHAWGGRVEFYPNERHVLKRVQLTEEILADHNPTKQGKETT